MSNLLGWFRHRDSIRKKHSGHFRKLSQEIDADAELLKLGRVGEEQAVAEVSEAHRSSYARRRHRHEVHVQHRPQRRDAVRLDVAVGRVADETRRVPDAAEVDNLCANDARRLVDGLAVHLLLRRQAEHGSRLLGAENSHLKNGRLNLRLNLKLFRKIGPQRARLCCPSTRLKMLRDDSKV